MNNIKTDVLIIGSGLAGASAAIAAAEQGKHVTIITKTKLKQNTSLKIKLLKKFFQKYNYIKLNIYPDGGISRFRIFGKIK